MFATTMSLWVIMHKSAGEYPDFLLALCLHPGSFWPCVLKLYWCLFGAKKIVILLNMTCNMMQFQKRCYANVELFRCGKKGHGLRALEDIRRGSFIIEYVGEVCPFLGQLLFFISALCLHCALVLISRSAR